MIEMEKKKEKENICNMRGQNQVTQVRRGGKKVKTFFSAIWVTERKEKVEHI